MVLSSSKNECKLEKTKKLLRLISQSFQQLSEVELQQWRFTARSQLSLANDCIF